MHNELGCYLPASGFTFTRTELHAAAGAIVARAREKFGDSAEIQAGLWSYREQGCSFLSCDLSVGDNYMPLTICAAGRYQLSYIDEPEVFDMAEAIHLAGIVITALGAKMTIGRQVNEVNPDVLQRPMKPDETNGRMNLWQD